MRRTDTARVSSSRALRTAAAGVVTAGALTAAFAVTPSAVASPGGLRHNPIPVRTAPTSANLPGTSCPVFPADNIWHADVSHLPVNVHSAAWLSHMQASTRNLHPDFGPSGGVPYGIGFTVVAGSHAKVAPVFDYADESDPGPYPLGSDTFIEGGANSGGDMHAIMVDSSTCRLYETWDTRQVGSVWHAGSGATWDLGSNALRTAG